MRCYISWLLGACVLLRAACAVGQGITEFPVPTAPSLPQSITAGADGNLWFTEDGALGRISPNSPHTITEFPTGVLYGGITSGPDGNLWFTDYGTFGGHEIGRILAGSPNTITEFPLPVPLSGPAGITSGPDGNLWLTELDNDAIGRILPGAPNTITEFPLPANSMPSHITTGLDGNLWFTANGAIGQMLPADPNTVTEFPVPGLSFYLGGITSGPDGNLWFTENGAIGRITSTGSVTEFPLPNALSGALGITTGTDGNLWFTETTTAMIGRILPASPNTITEFPLTLFSAAWEITSGPDGNLWFADLGDKIGVAPTDLQAPPPGLIPGGASAQITDCRLELLTQPQPGSAHSGLPANKLTCTDDDPLCDFGASAGDLACTFHVALCLNVPEQRFLCAPTDVESVQLASPPEANPKNAIDLANRDALEAAVMGVNGVIRGRCTRPKENAGQLCAANADCDSSPGSGNGMCAGRLLAFIPAVSTMPVCTAFVDIQVPLRRAGAASGSKTLRIVTRPSNDPITGKKRPADRDDLKLVCRPKP